MECFAGLGGQKLANNKSRQKVQPTANRKSNSQRKIEGQRKKKQFEKLIV